MKKYTTGITTTATIAALYLLLTLCARLFGLDSGVYQVRLSEMLTILPVFTPYAIPGVTLGCFLSNLMLTGNPIDLVVGTLATLLGASGAYILRRYPVLAPLPTILANMFLIPLVLIFAFGLEGGYWFLAFTVGVGELISAGILGLLLYITIKKRKLDTLLFNHAQN